MIQRLSEFCEDTDVHGLKFVANRSRGRLRQVVWAVLITGALGFLAYFFQLRIRDYQAHEVATKTTIVTSKVRLPGAKVCANLDFIVDVGKLTAHDIVYINKVVGLRLRESTLRLEGGEIKLTTAAVNYFRQVVEIPGDPADQSAADKQLLDQMGDFLEEVEDWSDPMSKPNWRVMLSTLARHGSQAALNLQQNLVELLYRTMFDYTETLDCRVNVLHEENNTVSKVDCSEDGWHTRNWWNMTIWLVFDSQALHDRLHTPKRSTADDRTVEAVRLLHDLGQRHHVITVWVPGHAGLPQNERADQAAREGCRMPQPDSRPSYQALCGRIRRGCHRAADDFYLQDVPPGHLHRRLSGGRPLPLDSGRSREADVALFQLRANRAAFLQAPRHLWGRADSPECPHCGLAAEDTEHHLLDCPRWAAARAAHLGSPPLDIGVLQSEVEEVCRFLAETGSLATPPYVARDQGPE